MQASRFAKEHDPGVAWRDRPRQRYRGTPRNGRPRTVRSGNALTEDLGEAAFDVVMLNNVAHHFTSAQNFELAKRVSRALAPGGIYTVGEFLRADTPGAGGVVAATMNLYFALTSASGAWSLEEIASWQSEAGLKPPEATGVGCLARDNARLAARRYDDNGPASRWKLILISESTERVARLQIGS